MSDEDWQYWIVNGDCVEVMNAMQPDNIDSIVCDPPYEINFMGKGWDNAGVAFDVETWKAAYRVLKPGGHLLAFGATRTYHRMAVAIEDAGFEIRDSIMWIYGTGFPKSQNVGKAIDKQAGAEREVIGRRTDGRYAYEFNGTANRPTGAASGTEDAERIGGFVSDKSEITAPATPEAEQWEGWGTALKPAHEPIIVARKPLSEKTVAKNVLKHGTGAINVDDCRVGNAGGPTSVGEPNHLNQVYGEGMGGLPSVPLNAGRWPANVIFDEERAAELDEQSGITKDGVAGGQHRGFRKDQYVGGSQEEDSGLPSLGFGGSGGASRFFYVAKSATKERNRGLEEGEKNTHPTVKPITLMRYLVRLVTPPDGTVLDPFCGSGTTIMAAVEEGFRGVGIELSEEYTELATKRVESCL